MGTPDHRDVEFDISPQSQPLLTPDDAENTFIGILLDRLAAPEGRVARDELIAANPAETRRWAAKWHVDAPWLDAAALLNDVQVERRARGREPPPAWRHELERIDALRPSGLARAGLRAELLVKADQLLAPVAANPWTETRPQFLARAAAHYDDRSARLRQLAPTIDVPTDTGGRPWPGLRKHIAWLVDYQFTGKSFAAIARTVPEVTTATAIRVAVTRVARRLGIRLRSSARPGRPKASGRRK